MSDLKRDVEIIKKEEPRLREKACRGSRLVEVTGLEPAASASRTQRSTKLSHTSKYLVLPHRALPQWATSNQPSPTHGEKEKNVQAGSTYLSIHNILLYTIFGIWQVIFLKM